MSPFSVASAMYSGVRTNSKHCSGRREFAELQGCRPSRAAANAAGLRWKRTSACSVALLCGFHGGALCHNFPCSATVGHRMDVFYEVSASKRNSRHRALLSRLGTTFSSPLPRSVQLHSLHAVAAYSPFHKAAIGRQKRNQVRLFFFKFLFV